MISDLIYKIFLIYNFTTRVRKFLHDYFFKRVTYGGNDKAIILDQGPKVGCGCWLRDGIEMYG